MAKKTKKRVSRSGSPKSEPVKNDSELVTVSTTELRQELARRSRQQASLERRREKLLGQLAEVDSQLSEFGIAGADITTGRRTRPKNEMNLEDALVKTLKGKTMGVTELADAVQTDGYKTHSANFRTIVNQALIRSKKFKKVSRGQYTTS